MAMSRLDTEQARAELLVLLVRIKRPRSARIA